MTVIERELEERGEVCIDDFSAREIAENETIVINLNNDYKEVFNTKTLRSVDFSKNGKSRSIDEKEYTSIENFIEENAGRKILAVA